MKKITYAIIISLFSFSYAGDVTPTISLRVENVLEGLDFASPIIGLKMGISDGYNSGFDANATGTRIYIERSYVGKLGRVGLGTYTSGTDEGKPYFTIGTSYAAYDNVNVDLEYVVNNLATADDLLQLSLTIGF